MASKYIKLVRSAYSLRIILWTGTIQRHRSRLFFYMNGIRLSHVLSPTTHVIPNHSIYIVHVLSLKICYTWEGMLRVWKKGYWVVEQLLILPLILWWNLNFFHGIKAMLAHVWSPTTILALHYSIYDYNSSCKYKIKLTRLTNNSILFKKNK